MKPYASLLNSVIKLPIPSAKAGIRQGLRFPGSFVAYPRAKAVTLLACAFALGHGSIASAAVLGFQGDFHPSNWTFTVSNGGDGFVNTSGAPGGISLTSSNNGVFNVNEFLSNVDYTIVAPFTGTIDFNWSYLTSDSEGANWDRFFVLLNGSPTQLSNNSGLAQQSGSVSFAVLMGDDFGFRQGSLDSIFGSATTTISNLSISAVPEPGSMLALGLLISGGAFLRTRRCKAAGLLSESDS